MLVIPSIVIFRHETVPKSICFSAVLAKAVFSCILTKHFQHFIPETIPEHNVFSKKIRSCGSKTFHDIPLKFLLNRQLLSSKCYISSVSLNLIPKNIPKQDFFEHES